jgi:hypothetical protein
VREKAGLPEPVGAVRRCGFDWPGRPLRGAGQPWAGIAERHPGATAAMDMMPARPVGRNGQQAFTLSLILFISPLTTGRFPQTGEAG